MTAPSVTTSSALRYTVRNGWAWAYIYVDHGVVTDSALAAGERRWVNVSVISDYGSFGFCWSHIGCDWREFLAHIDMHYAMNKMMGARFHIELTGEEAADEARKTVLGDRRNGTLTRAQAFTLWEAINDADKDYGANAFIRSWDDHSSGAVYNGEYYSGRWTKVNPQAAGFWSEIWPHFVANITADLAPAVAA